MVKKGSAVAARKQRTFWRSNAALCRPSPGEEVEAGAGVLLEVEAGAGVLFAGALQRDALSSQSRPGCGCSAAGLESTPCINCVAEVSTLRPRL